MASPSEKLAKSLEILEALQRQGTVAIRSAHLPRTHRERLVANGFLKEVMKGWYFPVPPDEPAGDSLDGNGRIGRFLMNVMLASGGYPWTVVPLRERAGYMAALEEASVRQDIVPFVDFLAALVEASLQGDTAPVPGA